MSKLLKKIATSHRPHLAAKMTPENGYDESKHHFASDLLAAGILDTDEAADLDGCLDDLAKDGHDGALAMKAAKSGEIDKDKLNFEEYINNLFGAEDAGSARDRSEAFTN